MIQERVSDYVHKRWLKDLGIKSFKGKKVLDLGCGSGFICQEAINDEAKLAVGVDIAFPETHSSERGFYFVQMDLEELWTSEIRQKVPNIDDGFDLILAFDIIEHLSSPFTFLADTVSLLRENGKLIVTTPNTNSWERWLRPHSWSGVRDPQHKILFTKHSLSFLLQKTGLKPVQLKAPVNKLSFLGKLAPPIGAQLLCQAQKVHKSQQC